jgi:hypothetical protein
MADTPKSGKKDQSVTRESREEVNEERSQDRTQPQYRNPNRDQVRGDWDRSQRHHDEDMDRPSEEAEERECPGF